MARTDAELVADARNGEEDAFAELIRRFQGLVFSIILHYLGRRADAEDLAQEVFLKVYRNLEGFDVSRPVKPWIARITANSCLDYLRQARRRRSTLFSDLSRSEETSVESFFEHSMEGSAVSEEEAEASLELLQRLMEGLNEKDRMAFVLRELEGMSYAEVAETLGVSELASRIRVSRVRKKLQEQMQGLLYRKA